MFELEKEKLDKLEAIIKECGNKAVFNQRTIHRNFKEDGSVVTETDLEISYIVEKAIDTLFPSCTFISEEFPIKKKESSEYIFILDPIDGTDVYSQGLPSFAISLGILDKNLNPVGAMILAPRFGIATDSLFIRLDPGKNVLLNGEEVKAVTNKDEIKQVIVGSSAHKRLDMRLYKGKVRSFGSTILHILLPSLLSSIQGSINSPCYVWDIAAAHAVIKALKMDAEYQDGTLFTYTNEFVFNKITFKSELYVGTEKGRKEMIKLLPSK